jgi:arsenate reductase (thioredoxin)
MIAVLFACVHNAGRSQIAAALFNRHCDPTRVAGVSAGTQPAERVHPEVVAAMGELGIDLSAARPRHLTSEMEREVAFLVTMGCGEPCPFIPAERRVDWRIEDPKGKPLPRIREIRDEIQDPRDPRRDPGAREAAHRRARLGPIAPALSPIGKTGRRLAYHPP